MVLVNSMAIPIAWITRFHAGFRRRLTAWRGYSPTDAAVPAASPDAVPEPPVCCEPEPLAVVEPPAEPSPVAVIQRPARRDAYPARIGRSLRGCDVRLGVSAKWLATQAESLGLDDDDIDAVISARREYRASVPSMLKAIRHGVSPLALPGLYSVRDEAAALCAGPAFSLKWIYAFTETFPEAELDRADLAEFMVEVHQQVAARVPWVWKYPDDALRMLIRVSESYGSNIVDSCLGMLGSCPDETEVLAEEIDQ
jgi:hypothetical protein